MAMASTENAKEYVLQWAGHAAHVTERFSGLLARQALVDVTLICQGQKLRVHKLVLASSSLYFEEMLEEDLGQEPVILLRDLDFQVLKAMVEFMYCGETTISQCHLQTLLDAAQVFKVKELKCIVETMIKSKVNNKVLSDCGDSGTTEIARAEDKNYRVHPSGERCDEKCSPADFQDAEISESKDDRLLDNKSQTNYIDDENSLYETSERMEEPPCPSPIAEILDQASPSISDCESSKLSTSEDDRDPDETSEVSKISSDSAEDDSLRTIYETRCCKFIEGTELGNHFDNSTTDSTDDQDLPRSVGECSKVYTHKKRKLTSNSESSEGTGESAGKILKFDENISRNEEEKKLLGKSLKVYSHKRCKSSDEKKCQILNDVNSAMQGSLSTSNIDLTIDASSNNAPIDLVTSLDMETSEYIWSLSAESIQYVVGCTINPVVTNEITNTQDNSRFEDNCVTMEPRYSERNQDKELFSCEDDENLDIFETPILRRSVRRGNPESDDSLNNNRTSKTERVREKSLERDKEKSRRRVNKESNCRLVDENFAKAPSTPDKKDNSRSLKGESKLPSRKAKITRSVRDEKRRSGRHGREKSESSSDILVNTRLNTIASVDRSLWGDMSDVLENNRKDSSEDLLNYSSSREIPFAVGLLPLRAALERMQATLDHQPRKTRSSVAPWKQEMLLQRKRTANDSENSPSRKQNNLESQSIERAVCHIEIRTSSSQSETKNNKIATDEKVITVGTDGERNKQ